MSKKYKNMKHKNAFYSHRLIAFAGTFLLAISTLFGQGFVKYYPLISLNSGTPQEGAQSVFPQANGNFLMTYILNSDFAAAKNLGWLEVDPSGLVVSGDTLQHYDLNEIAFELQNDGTIFVAEPGTDTVWVRHLDNTGALLWQTAVPIFSGMTDILTPLVRTNAAGDVFVNIFSFSSPAAASYIIAAKLTGTGTLLWTQHIGNSSTSSQTVYLHPTADGGCLVGGSNPVPSIFGPTIYHLNPDGSIKWQYNSEGNKSVVTYNGIRSITENQQGEALIPINYFNAGAALDSFDLAKVDATGQVLWAINLNDSIQAPISSITTRLSVPLADGGFAVVATYNFQNNITTTITKINSNGSIGWTKNLSFVGTATATNWKDGRELSDGSIVLYGSAFGKMILVKLSTDGQIYPYSLTGRVVRDSDFNCTLSAADEGMNQRIVKATSNSLEHFAITNGNGEYTINDLEAGDYIAILSTANYAWTACLDTVAFSFVSGGQTIDTINFMVQPLGDCPVMQVDLGIPNLRRCNNNNQFYVHYCNAGNQTADPTIIDVVLDPLMTFSSSNLSYTLSGDTVRFNVGATEAGACDHFYFSVSLSCDAQLGSTYCAEAHIYPDTLCKQNTNWFGACVQLRATCEGDSVAFYIKNVGPGNMSGPLDFIVVDDHVITRQGNYQLDVNEVEVIKEPADGSTWRVIADQEPGHPFGPLPLSLGVEGCANTPGATVGMLNLFSNNTGILQTDVACTTVTGSFDPNDKQGLPLGVDAAHYIDPNQPIEYRVRFQNTGTDTAFTVVIRDTLSALLDPTTLRAGASSHPYTLQMTGQGFINFVFDDILLPDSTVNEPGSHGFVEFTVTPRIGVPLESVVYNQAAIYFDFNEPVVTNQTWHTLGQNYLTTAVITPKHADWTIQAFPNPTTEMVTITVSSSKNQQKTAVLRDLMGKIIAEQQFNGDMAQIPCNNLLPGIYIMDVMGLNGSLGVVKLVVR